MKTAHINKVLTISAGAVFALMAVVSPPVYCQGESKSIEVLNYITGWSLDAGAGGYHPAIFMLLENVSGKDLSGVSIKFQGKFLDNHTLESQVARKEERRSLKPLQQFRMELISPTGYELPRDVSFWPRLDCKVMARVGQVGDEGTETLVTTSIDPITQTRDDAFQKLNEQTSFNRTTSHRSSHNKPPKPQTPVEPLTATALKAPGGQTSSAKPSSPVRDLLSSKTLPGLGDDFYAFEQVFGLPILTDSRKKDFTWAKFKHKSSGQEVVVCSRDMTGKADMIVMQVGRDIFPGQDELFSKARNFSGRFKSQTPAKPVKSVRYLSGGRLEISTSQSQDYRMVCLATPAANQGEGSFIIVITRLPQEASAMLIEQVKDNPVLKGLPVIQ